MDYNITLPFTPEQIAGFQKYDVLYLMGTIYTARDAAHKRMYEAVCGILSEYIKNEPENSLDSQFLKIINDDETDIDRSEVMNRIRSVIPFDLENAVIYYLGPTPARPGQVIGSAGPTTSGRMDKYTPLLLDLGLKGMIGKGRRSDAVEEAIRRNKAVYLGATGGAGALLSKCIKSSEIIAYEDLGTEAIRKLYVENFPVTVLIK